MFIKIAEACVPHQNVIIRPRDKPWMNSEIRKCINNRRKLFYEFKRSNLDSVKSDYKQLRNKILSMVKEAKNVGPYMKLKLNKFYVIQQQNRNSGGVY